MVRSERGGREGQVVRDTVTSSIPTTGTSVPSFSETLKAELPDHSPSKQSVVEMQCQKRCNSESLA